MIGGAHRLPYEFIKNLQQAIRKPNGRKSTVKDMLVLSQQNDPLSEKAPRVKRGCGLYLCIRLCPWRITSVCTLCSREEGGQ
jgi:hypothetical protein